MYVGHIAAYRRTRSPGRLACSEGWRPASGAGLRTSDEPGELLKWLSRDDSTINIVIRISIIISLNVKLSQLEAGHSIECITHTCHSIAFLHFVTLLPWPLTFWPNINCWTRYHDGLSICQFGDLSFSRFVFIVRTDRQTDRQNHRCAWSLYSPDYCRYTKYYDWLY